MSTQTRISSGAHELLTRLAQETGKTHQDVLDRALRAYEREIFFQRLNAGFAALRADPTAWAQEKKEREEWDATLADDLTDE